MLRAQSFTGWNSAIRRCSGSLREDDRRLFHEIVGSPVEELTAALSEAPSRFVQRVFSDKKIIDDLSWNQRGLHVYRCLTAERLLDAHRRRRGLDRVPEHRDYVRDGVLVVPDFLKPAELDAYRDQERLPGPSRKRLAALLQTCSGIGRWRGELPMRTVVAEDGDKQRELHVDTFFSSVKVWYYDRDMELADGPLHVVLGSHRNHPAKLRWLHRRSLIAGEARHPDLRRHFPGGWAGGSIRLHAGGDAAVALAAMGFDEEAPMVYGANTLILVDTSALHRRGVAPAGTVRRTGRAKHRLCPFRLLNPLDPARRSARVLGAPGDRRPLGLST